MKRATAILLALVLILGVCLPSLAEGSRAHGPGGTPPEGMGQPPQGGPGMGEGAMAGTGNAINVVGRIDVTNGSVSAEDALNASITASDGVVTIAELDYESGDYGDTLLSASNSDVHLTDATIDLNVDEAVTGSESAGTAACVDSGTLKISDSTLTVSGAGRYTVAATDTATMVVESSVIVAGGDNGANGRTSSVSEPASNAGLLISGTSRANFSVGQTHTFYYDSLCVADGWAALSTDSATGSGLEFVGVNTEALALHGGYGIYADTNCRDYLYGATLVSAEVGAILSNNGALTVGSGEDAKTASTQDGLSALTYYDGDLDASTRTTIIAGRNDFQLHSPDMMGDGRSDYSAQLTLSHATLITDETINADGFQYLSNANGETYTVQATGNYAEKYGEAVGAYIDYVTGAAVLVKSTSADIALTDVEIRSSSGVALLSALNSDSMSRYLKQDVGNGVNVSIADSVIDGDFVNDDYQRDMKIVLDGATLSGDVTFSTAEEWNARWANWAQDENACWVNLDAGAYVTDTHATELTLSNGSVWNVRATSRLTTLTVSADSTVNGEIEADSTQILDDGTQVYTGVTVKAAQ